MSVERFRDGRLPWPRLQAGLLRIVDKLPFEHAALWARGPTRSRGATLAARRRPSQPYQTCEMTSACGSASSPVKSVIIFPMPSLNCLMKSGRSQL